MIKKKKYKCENEISHIRFCVSCIKIVTLSTNVQEIAQ